MTGAAGASLPRPRGTRRWQAGLPAGAGARHCAVQHCAVQHCAAQLEQRDVRCWRAADAVHVTVSAGDNDAHHAIGLRLLHVNASRQELANI